MANELFCDEEAAREADDAELFRHCGRMRSPRPSTNQTGPGRDTERFPTQRLIERILSRKISAKAPEEQLPPAPAQDGSPSALAMSGDDFYRAACVEAHAPFKPALTESWSQPPESNRRDGYRTILAKQGSKWSATVSPTPRRTRSADRHH
jgi:hypothetical protein